jgi:hypothetical protein
MERLLPASYTLASQLYIDPDPESQVVDVKSDSEFITGIEEKVLTFKAVDGAHAEKAGPSSAYENELQLKIWRERAAMMEESSAILEEAPSEMRPKKMKRVDDLTPIEQVLKELSAKAIRGERAHSQSTISPSESHSTNESQSREMEEVTLGTVSADGVIASFPGPVMRLSKSFQRMMDKDEFDGIILLDEEHDAMENLIAWLSRGLDFEITIGIL